MKLKILDLFSGLGGFSLGLERTGNFETIAFCDNDKYSNLVLQKHWKGAKIYNDVKEITKEKLESDGIQFPDIITGGFPCQPFSVAGKQKGTSDDRHLWPEMFRIIQEFKPRWVIGENVKGLVNLQDGMVFETVCTDLEGEGYEVRAFNIPAAGVGAPHRRERIWIVAHAKRYNKTNEIGGSDETSRGIQEEHRQDDSPSRLTSRTSSIRQTNNGYEDVAHSNDTRNRTPEHETNEDGQKIDEGWQEQSQLKSSGHSENVEDSRRTLQQGTKLREKNEDEVREGYANQHQRSSSSSESNVANANINGAKRNQPEDGQRSRTQQSSEDVANTERKGLEGLNQQSTTISGKNERTYTRNESSRDQATGTEDVANTESSNRHDNEAITRDGGSSTQEIFGNGSSVSGESSWWHTEPNVGRVAHGIPGRVYRLKGLGNSIIPKIAEEIGKAIIKAEREE
jgi:DNA-cytosine methyltransferase